MFTGIITDLGRLRSLTSGGVARIVVETGFDTATIAHGDSLRFRFRAPDALARFIAPKGSIAVDGVSLTVNEVEGTTFGVNIIPVTLQETGFGRISPGHRVNLEIDLLARYLARLMDKERA